MNDERARTVSGERARAVSGEPRLVYVYAVVAPAPGLDGRLVGVRGVADAPVALLPEAATTGPAFLVSEVPAADWDEEALRHRFEDLGWLEDTARAHHRVVEVLAEHVNVLPLRLATLYQDRDRALEALSRRRDAFAARLALLAHHTEYGVKVYVAPEAEQDGAPAPPAGAPAPANPGRAYLQARRAQRHAREDRYRQAREVADRIAAAAARHATQAVRHPVQTGPLARGDDGENGASGASGATGENVLNDAYLVPDDRTDAFLAAMEEAGRDLPGIRVDVTGPWAPYSFAAPPPDDRGTPS
ncbi:GvpL/GvpF family gas vesicle protein [Streptomyces roseolus]|uniref:GvpL/GvpF family gas vesicle protein n=1 Tax=Streptomyces roseolus TaxID=67358 RepID=UPI003656DD54